MTIKQEWQRERMLKNKSMLLGMLDKLSILSVSPSTTPTEKARVDNARFNIQVLLDTYDLPNSKTLSFEQFERIRNGL